MELSTLVGTTEQIEQAEAIRVDYIAQADAQVAVRARLDAQYKGANDTRENHTIYIHLRTELAETPSAEWFIASKSKGATLEMMASAHRDILSGKVAARQARFPDAKPSARVAALIARFYS